MGEVSFMLAVDFRAQVVDFFDLFGKFVVAGTGKKHRYQCLFFSGERLVQGRNFRGRRRCCSSSIGFHILNISKNPYYPKLSKLAF